MLKPAEPVSIQPTYDISHRYCTLWEKKLHLAYKKHVIITVVSFIEHRSGIYQLTSHNIKKENESKALLYIESFIK